MDIHRCPKIGLHLKNDHWSDNSGGRKRTDDIDRVCRLSARPLAGAWCREDSSWLRSRLRSTDAPACLPRPSRESSNTRMQGRTWPEKSATSASSFAALVAATALAHPLDPPRLRAAIRVVRMAPKTCVLRAETFLDRADTSKRASALAGRLAEMLGTRGALDRRIQAAEVARLSCGIATERRPEKSVRTTTTPQRSRYSSIRRARPTDRVP